ncbi:MAG: hypothetical protein IIA51_05480 [Chloroflexi bacterium]|nr:hypothetical protein [Chloroflexota bacterium]MCH8339641.1 hypothetical protein [Chloroflexota bacterium]MCH8340989.1 hypothetical protein [Chloroflexota bacterium]MCI0773012.1 hypothetical protein [Chloroflexota bacterium]
MNKFIILQTGYETPTDEIMENYGKWFASIQDKIVDMSTLGKGREITKSGTKKLSMDLESITGFLVINAENIDEAVKIAESSPIITNVRVYEAMSMEGH